MRIFARWLMPAVLASVLLAAVSALSVAPAFGSECPNEQLRGESNENPVTHEAYDLVLPECRAYEMVSAVAKAGDPVQGPLSFVSPGVDGGAVTYDSYLGVFSEPEGFELHMPYRAVRGSGGWTTSAATAAASLLPYAYGENRTLYSPDLSRQVLCGSHGDGVETSYIATFMCAEREGNSKWRAATPAYPTVGSWRSGFNFKPGILGASRDLSHVVFTIEGETHLLSEDTIKTSFGVQETTGLYEVSGMGTPAATLKLVNVNNNGEQIGTVAPKLGNLLEPGYGIPTGRDLHAVSEDGSTVFFEATPTGGVQTLYARIGGTSTVPISKPSAVDCAECQIGVSPQLPAAFQGASTDGSKVFFTSEQELFAGKTGNNMYEYDFDAPVGQRLTLVSRGTANAAVQGVLTNSEDGSRIYFVAQGALTATANGAGQSAVAGADNLYVFQRDEAHPTGQVSFVAMLCSGEHASGTALDTQCASTSTDKQLWTLESNSYEGGRDQTTPDGRYLLFDTNANLAAEDTNKGAAVYRYDSQMGELTWISHAAPGYTVPNEGASAMIPATTIYGYPAAASPDVDNRGRAINDEGTDVVFTTSESLSPRDVNKGTDVYLWHEGVVSLISDGVNPAPAQDYPEDSAVMSASGGDIYFLATAKLVGQDPDELTDMYDARLDGGFPAPKVVECAAEESGDERGETCQGARSGAPSLETPASASFRGGANASPPAPATPAGGSKAKPQSTKKTLTRGQKLARALKACKKIKAKKKRATCERQAHKKYQGKAKQALKSGRGR